MTNTDATFDAFQALVETLVLKAKHEKAMQAAPFRDAEIAGEARGLLRSLGHSGFGRVDGKRDIDFRRKRPNCRQNALQFDLHRHRGSAGSSGLTAEVENVGAIGCQLTRAVEHAGDCLRRRFVSPYQRVAAE